MISETVTKVGKQCLSKCRGREGGYLVYDIEVVAVLVCDVYMQHMEVVGRCELVRNVGEGCAASLRNTVVQYERRYVRPSSVGD